MKKILSVMMILAMLLSMGSVALAEEEPQKITVMGLSWQITKIFIEEAATQFEKDHPGVEVVIETLPDYASLPTYAVNWMNGETDVDVLLIGDANNAAQFVSRDLLYDFEEDLKFFEEEGFAKEDFLGVGLLDGTINDKQYGMPIICEAYAMNCNNAAMKEAGLWDEDRDAPVMPANWDDVYEYAKKLTRLKMARLLLRARLYSGAPQHSRRLSRQNREWTAQSTMRMAF